MTAEDWGARAAWLRRSKEFHALIPYDDARPIVAMEYRPKKTQRWHRLRELWLGLPPHPHIIDALEPCGDEGILLRYAAIDWIRPRILDDGRHRYRARVAQRCAQIVDVFEFLHEHVGDDIGLFANPRIKIDLDDQIRMLFSPEPPPYEPPREVLLDRPRWDEQTLVYLVGAQLDQVVRFEGRTYMAQVAEKCLAKFSRKRFSSLPHLRKQCEEYGADRPSNLTDSERIGWAMIEEAFGWMDLGRFDDALPCLEDARAYAHRLEIIHWALENVQAGRGLGEEVAPTDHIDVRVPHSSPIAVKQWLEVLRPRGNDIVAGEILDRSPQARALRQARASLKANDAIFALDQAETLLCKDADDRDAAAITIDALLRLGRFTEALAHADRLVTRAADVGRHHYLRGKALFRLGRLAEARDSFELALSLDPKLVEAMLLRREVDRAMKIARAEAGTQVAPMIELPASLETLRDVIAAGGARAIVEALSAAEHADNPDAQLLLARYLVLDGERERATTIYERLALAPPPHRHRALVGNAGLLLDAGSHESALALFEVVCAEAPNDLDASEGRAQTLEKLGRLGEAAAEYRRFVGLANARADLRVRAAQQWLDDHVL